jgi:protoporphyrinogen oxidase
MRRKRFSKIRFELQSRFPGLHLVGRNGMHKYNNQDHAKMTGMLTTANILAGRTLYDLWAVNEDAQYGEAGLSGAREALQARVSFRKKWRETVSTTAHAASPSLREMPT